jgi:hypothetical protein
MKTGIVFLCKEIKQPILDFCYEILAKKFASVYIVSDEQDCLDDLKEINWIVQHSGNVTKLFVRDSTCIKDGYVGCNNDNTHIKKQVIAYDKFLWLFAKKNLDNLDNIWVFEDDCFIPSVDALISLNEKYKKLDLVTPNNFKKNDSVLDWHWKAISESIKEPYYYSMVCGAMFSNKMLLEIRKYVLENNKLFYIEAMFNTLAMQVGLNVIGAPELKSIVWVGEWGLDEFVQLPNNIFHPLKDIENHKEYRKDIKTAVAISYNPIKELPKFLR